MTTLEDTRTKLINMRSVFGADTPAGHCVSNIVEQVQNMVTYVRPSWASHEMQTLPYMLKRQSERLTMLRKAGA